MSRKPSQATLHFSFKNTYLQDRLLKFHFLIQDKGYNTFCPDFTKFFVIRILLQQIRNDMDHLLANRNCRISATRPQHLQYKLTSTTLTALNSYRVFLSYLPVLVIKHEPELSEHKNVANFYRAGKIW